MVWISYNQVLYEKNNELKLIFYYLNLNNKNE